MADAPANQADIEKAAHAVVDNLGLTEEMQEKTTSMLDAMAGGASFGDIYGIEPRKLEMVYSVARTFYQNRKYEDALKMFRFLTMMSHTNQKYWMGYASTHQMMKDYEKAVEGYGYATLLDVQDARPQLQAGYCLIQLGKLEEAAYALEGVLLTDELDAKTELQAKALLSKIERAESAAE